MQAAANLKLERGQSGTISPTQTGNSTRPPPKLIPRPLEPAPVAQPLSQVYTEPSTPPVSAPIDDPELSIHPTLRSPGYVPTANMMSSGLPGSSEHPGVGPGPANASGLSPIDTGADGRSKAKRELSQSKRAAQNRAAQRAFRQRKEGYIKKLEAQVRDYDAMDQSLKMMQAENYALKEYIAHLQGRLVDAQIEPPPPPPNINLSETHGAPGPEAHGLPQPDPGHEDPLPGGPDRIVPNTGAASGAASLDAVAQAVQSLSRSEASYKTEAENSQAVEDARTAEEISRQLSQAEPVPAANM